MSRTTILGLSPGGGVGPVVLKELQNSHGSAPVIWDALSEEFLGRGTMGFGWRRLDDLWPKWRDASIPEYKRAVLMMTYDYAYVQKEHYARAAADIRKWLEEFPPAGGCVNHWPAIAEFYERDPDCDAVGIWHTSVTDNPFLVKQDGEGYPEFYEVYDELDTVGQERSAHGQLIDALEHARDQLPSGCRVVITAQNGIFTVELFDGDGVGIEYGHATRTFMIAHIAERVCGAVETACDEFGAADRKTG